MQKIFKTCVKLLRHIHIRAVPRAFQNYFIAIFVLRPFVDDISLHRYIVFSATDQKSVTPLFLKKLNDGEVPTHIFICGADTDCCVLKTATDLFEQSVMPIVLTEYCDSNGGPESHKSGIMVMDRLIGKKSIVADKITSKEDIEKIIAERQY